MPPPSGERGELCLCDGCAAEVAEGGVPACVAACPLDALAFDDRDAVVSRANERAAALRERGWANASVLGVSEQGGHHVVQVMKYGAAGSMHEALASTGEVEWLDAAKMAGPVSVGVLGLAAAGAVAGLVSESRKQRVAETEAAAASVAAFNPLLGQTRPLKAGRAPMAMRARSWKRALFRPLCAVAMPCVPGRAPHRPPPRLLQWPPYRWRSTTGTTPMLRATMRRKASSRAS